MHEGLKLLLSSAVNMQGPPHAGFEINGQLESAEHFAVLGLGFSVRMSKPQMRVQPDRDIDRMSLQARLRPGSPMSVYLPVTFNRDVLQLIESERNHEGEVEFQIQARALVAPMNESTPGYPETAHVDVRGPDDRANYFRMSRDAWIGFLRTSRYSDLEVFELPVHGLKAKGLPDEALSSIHAAEKAFRSGDWDGTMTKCRAAFEAVSTATAGEADLKVAFEKLWTALLPDEVDAGKRTALNAIVVGLGKFQHLGRHKTFPFTPVDRHDALLALRLSLSLFEYMGARAAV